MLAVVSIIGVLAAIVIPNLAKFKPNVTAGAERVLLSELARARQLAISQRTTVYMAFVPTNFFALTAYTDLSNKQPLERAKADRLLDKQMIGYAFISLKTLGDQPGQRNPRYLSPWRTLPEGSYIPPEKFALRVMPLTWSSAVMTITNASAPYLVAGFMTNSLPFPSEHSTNYFNLPCVAFNYLGELVDQQGNPLQMDEIIPLTKGSVAFARYPDKTPKAVPPAVTENPPGNATNSFDLVKIEWLTGRAHPERLEVR